MKKIKKINKIKILNEEEVVKEEKNLEELYLYLEARNFNKYLKYKKYKDNRAYYPYIKEINIDNNQKGEDLIKIVAELHNKTSFNKEINQTKYDEIYNKMLGYINYLEEYYNNILISYEIKEYPSPSEQLFINNYFKLQELFTFLKDEINSYHENIKEKNKERLVLNHGNLDLDHLLKDKEEYLISWNNSKFDTPILDITNLYHNVWDKTHFSTLLEIYLDKCKLLEEEKKLLFINIAIPKKIDIKSKEIENTKEIYNLFKYIYATEELIRPYYTK